MKEGRITYIDDVEIHPSIITDYIFEMGKQYNIKMVLLDNFRFTLLSDALAKIGFRTEAGNLRLISQMDILRIVPVIDHCFANQYFCWGDNPVLRWSVNNTKLVPYGKKAGIDRGSFVYAKIEAKSRKNDPFMALVASMIGEGEIKEYVPLTDKTPLVL